MTSLQSLWPKSDILSRVGDGTDPAAAWWIARIYLSIPQACPSGVDESTWSRVISSIRKTCAESATCVDLSKSLSVVHGSILNDSGGNHIYSDLSPGFRAIGIRASRMINPENHGLMVRQATSATEGDIGWGAVVHAMSAAPQEIAKANRDDHALSRINEENNAIFSNLEIMLQIIGLPYEAGSLGSSIVVSDSGLSGYDHTERVMTLPVDGQGVTYAWGKAYDHIIYDRLFPSCEIPGPFSNAVFECSTLDDYSPLERAASGNPIALAALDNMRATVAAMCTRTLGADDLILEAQSKLCSAKMLLSDTAAAISAGVSIADRGVAAAKIRSLSSDLVESASGASTQKLADDAITRFVEGCRYLTSDQYMLTLAEGAASSYIKAQQRLVKVRNGHISATYGWSRYFMNSRRLDGVSSNPRFADPGDMFARAFHAYVMNEAGRAAAVSGKAFPPEDERRQIAESIHKLISDSAEVVATPPSHRNSPRMAA